MWCEKRDKIGEKVLVMIQSGLTTKSHSAFFCILVIELVILFKNRVSKSKDTPTPQVN